MQKIDKTRSTLPLTYKKWLAQDVDFGKNFRHYYDDIVMNLYKCQHGVCAYTEMFICIPDLYNPANWVKGRYQIPNEAEYKRIDHLGELEHFDANNKKVKYWNWDNLFMIHSKVNSIKSNGASLPYLKPDLPDYAPETYFEYDEQTHRYIPNTDIDSIETTAEIQHMIDKVLFLNHGVVRKDRENYINELKDKKLRGQQFTVDRFFTSVRWVVLEDKM